GDGHGFLLPSQSADRVYAAHLSAQTERLLPATGQRESQVASGWPAIPTSVLVHSPSSPTFMSMAPKSLNPTTKPTLPSRPGTRMGPLGSSGAGSGRVLDSSMPPVPTTSCGGRRPSKPVA